MNINMNGIRRTCQSAFRSWNTVSLSANGSQRAFSRSCPRPRSSLPVFLEPSSPELASLLKVANSKLLLPYHLTKEQQKLVYRQANKTRLEADPIDITIGDVTLPLEHIDINHLPNRRKTLKDIVLNSKSRDDWENVIRLLEGFRDAGVVIKPQWREFIVRHLFLSDNQHLALKALQRPKATGFTLSDRLLLKTLVRGIHNKAAEADWTKDETIKSLRYAKQIIDLMEDEEHCGGKIVPAGRIGDWRGKPWVVALPTVLEAKLAEKHGGDKEEVSKLAKRLVNTLQQDKDLEPELETMAQRSTKTPADFANGSDHAFALHKTCDDILRYIVVWDALRTSRTVLGADMHLVDEAQLFEQRCKKVIDDAVKSLDNMATIKGQPISSTFVDHARNIVEKSQ